MTGSCPSDVIANARVTVAFARALEFSVPTPVGTLSQRQLLATLRDFPAVLDVTLFATGIIVLGVRHRDFLKVVPNDNSWWPILVVA